MEPEDCRGFSLPVYGATLNSSMSVTSPHPFVWPAILFYEELGLMGAY